MGRQTIRAGLAIWLGVLAALAGPAWGQDQRTQEVRFPPGSSGVQISGSVEGREDVSYVLAAKAGQRMTVALTSDNNATYFNVYAPGRGPGDEALATGDITGAMMPDVNRFDGVLPQDGRYTITVYLYRAAARRGERSAFELEIAIDPKDAAMPGSGDFADGLAGGPDFWEVAGVAANDMLNLRAAPSAQAEIRGRFANGEVLRNLGCSMEGGQKWCRVEPEADASVSGWVSGRYLREASAVPAQAAASGPAERAGRGEFDATGEIPCAQHAGQPMTRCAFGVARGGGGNATVVVTRGDGGKRAILFVDGRPVSADASRADANAGFSASKEADLNFVRIGDERYEIPDAVAFGG